MSEREPSMWMDKAREPWIDTGAKDAKGRKLLDRLNGSERLPIDAVEEKYGPLEPVT